MKTRTSYHVDLYRYWDAMRGSRTTPSRRDLDPAAIPRLLPYIALIDCADGSYRWRLMGSGVADDLGSDLTGQLFGKYVTPARFIGAMVATFDRVLDRGQPTFETMIYETVERARHAVSRLLLPLGAEAGRPAMILLTRIALRVPRDREQNLLRGAAGQLYDSSDVASIDELQDQVSAWEAAPQPSPVAQISARPNVGLADLWGSRLPHIVRCGGPTRELVPQL